MQLDASEILCFRHMQAIRMLVVGRRKGWIGDGGGLCGLGVAEVSGLDLAGAVGLAGWLGRFDAV